MTSSEIVAHLIKAFDPQEPHFHATEIFNESCLVKAVLYQASKLDIQQYWREPPAGCPSTWVRDWSCLLDVEHRDRPEKPGQLLGIWDHYGCGCDDYRPHDRMA